jgi:hypothetical protein
MGLGYRETSSAQQEEAGQKSLAVLAENGLICITALKRGR